MALPRTTFLLWNCTADHRHKENSMTEKKKQQKKIALQLKALVVVIALAGCAFLAFMTSYARYIYAYETHDGEWTFILFTYAIGIACAIILLLFWGVCTRIGNDNSFSMENAKALARMGGCGLVISAIALLRLIVFYVLFGSGLYMWYAAAETMLGIIFFVICSALSKLVKGAYELKQENDLTI